MIEVEVMPVMISPQTCSTPGEVCTSSVAFKLVMNFPRTSSTLGGMCVMDVEFMLGMNFPRTSSIPGEIGAVELGYRTVMGFSRLIPPRARVERLSWTFAGRAFRQASFPPGESGAEDCDYIYKAGLVGRIVSVCANGDWVTPVRISPQTCTELSPLGGSLSSVD